MKFSIVILGFIPDSIIAYTVMRLFNEKSWSFFIYVLLALQLFYFVRWLIQSAVDWFNFYLYKEEIVVLVYKTLKDNKFPNPNDYGFDEEFPEGYYRAILDDSDLNLDVRMIAQASHTEIGTLRSFRLIQALFRLLKAHSEGIKRYQMDFKRGKSAG